jgi:hypothetical protein
VLDLALIEVTVLRTSGSELSGKNLAMCLQPTLGHPGTAYLTQRPSEFEYVLRVVIAFKSLPATRQRQLVQENAPWDFGTWLDEQQGSDRRLARNVFLYFLSG